MWDLDTIKRINRAHAMLERNPDFPIRDSVKLATQLKSKLEELEAQDKIVPVEVINN